MKVLIHCASSCSTVPSSLHRGVMEVEVESLTGSIGIDVTGLPESEQTQARENVSRNLALVLHELVQLLHVDARERILALVAQGEPEKEEAIPVG